MGNRQTVQPLIGGPRTFYLVSGGPRIRYVGHPSSAGPLIFHIETDLMDENEAVDRAETIQLPVAVPSRQKFRLVQLDSKNRESGFLLSFSIVMSEPGQTLRVLAGVDIEYRAGEGVQLMQSEKSQNPFCLLEFVSPEEFREEIEVSEVLHPEKLNKAIFRYSENGARRLTYAPIAIELVYEAPTDRAPSKGPDFIGPSSAKSVFASRQECENSMSHNGHASFAATLLPQTERMVQYTFLDIPEGALGRTKVSFLPKSEPQEGAARIVYEAKILRQLLQHGTQVYELDDVFDLGGDGSENNLDGNDEEEEEIDLCVICLLNPKDTTLLPCRHMCLCYECASILRFQQNNRCPVCRSNIDRVMTL
ncbi:hypothetical protein TCSYLVIO_000510 [Trypanosoma cruzi]|nr:hypothetical protein TCSYLVIO_000510 [Trypanosoma cruzi]